MAHREQMGFCEKMRDRFPQHFQNKKVLDSKAAFVETTYWSSSEFRSTNAWKQYFNTGNQYSNNKTLASYVRAVRSIKL